MKSLKVLFFIIFCFLLQGCPTQPEEVTVGFTIVNNSNEIIYDKGSHNKDEVVIYEPTELDRIRINDSTTDATYKIFFTQGRLLTIFIYKQSTLTKYPWAEIKEKGLWDKRYDLTLAQLDSLKYRIVYTGN